MTIKTTAIAVAIILTATSANAHIRLDREFCGDKYCGQFYQPRYAPYQKKVHKTYRQARQIKIHKEKRVRVAWVGPIQQTLTSGLAAEARKYLGMNAQQLGVRLTLWCSAFIRKITGASNVDDRAISWLRKPFIKPQINAIAVMRNHVGIVAGFDRFGNPILISGNSGPRYDRKVTISKYSKDRILAYVGV